MSKISKIAPTNEELDELNKDQFNLIISHLAGENYRELAHNFNLPIGTVKSRLHRATIKLLENRKNATNCIN